MEAQKVQVNGRMRWEKIEMKCEDIALNSLSRLLLLGILV